MLRSRVAPTTRVRLSKWVFLSPGLDGCWTDFKLHLTLISRHIQDPKRHPFIVFTVIHPEE